MLTRLKNGTSLDLRKVVRVVPRLALVGGAVLNHVEVWYRAPRKSTPECRRVCCDDATEYAAELAALVAKAQGSGNGNA